MPPTTSSQPSLGTIEQKGQVAPEDAEISALIQGAIRIDLIAKSAEGWLPVPCLSLLG